MAVIEVGPGGPDELRLYFTQDPAFGEPARINVGVVENGVFAGNSGEYIPIEAPRGTEPDVVVIRDDIAADASFYFSFLNDNWIAELGDRNVQLVRAEINGVAIEGAALEAFTGGDYGPVYFNGDAEPPPEPEPEPVVLRGTAGPNRLEGGGGDDRLSGLGGADTLLGAGGADALNGGTGDDSMDGGAGDDWLNGGTGADTLAGGGGADLFVYGAATQGVDTITDFDASQDDRVDVGAILGFFGTDCETLAEGGFVRVVNTPNGVRLDVDEDGGGNNYAALLTFEGATVATLGTDFIVT